MDNLHPKLLERVNSLLVRMKELGYNLRIVSGYRSFKDQDDLYAQGRTKPGKIVTNAKGGQSYHNYGLAVDLAFVIDGKISWDEKLPWSRLGMEGKQFGLEWGGLFKKFKDRPHFQYTNGFSLDVLRDLYNKNGLNKVWEII